MVKLGPGLRPQRPTPHGPPTSSGGREKWFIDGRRKREPERLLFAFFPKGTLSHPQPAQPVGGPLRAFNCEGRRPGTKKEVQPPPTHPHQRRESRGTNLFPLGFFPPFLPKKWGPGWASQGSLPFQRRKEKTRNAPRLGGPRSRPFQRRREPHHTPPLETVPPERRPP